jgi:Holliday junction resolvase RusA-like endonuclease
MIFHRIDVKPLSANEAYAPRAMKAGNRMYATIYKTVKFAKYEADVKKRLKNLKFDLGASGELVLCIRVFYETAASDIDNCIKSFLDILQRHYKFNDNRVYVLNVVKEVAGKGKAGIEFYLDTRENYMKEKHYVRPYTPYGAILPRNTTKQIVINTVTEPSSDNREEQLYALDKQSRLTGSVGQGVHYLIFTNGDIMTLRPDTVRGDLIELSDAHSIYVRVLTLDGKSEDVSTVQDATLGELLDLLAERYGETELITHEGYK